MCIRDRHRRVLTGPPQEGRDRDDFDDRRNLPVGVLGLREARQHVLARLLATVIDVGEERYADLLERIIARKHAAAIELAGSRCEHVDELRAVFIRYAEQVRDHERRIRMGVGDVYKRQALVAATRTLAVELGLDNIRVNAVAPGVTATPASLTFVGEDPVRDQKAIAMGRRARPEEQAGAILFLLSDLSSYVTGQTILVDGGLHLR